VRFSGSSSSGSGVGTLSQPQDRSPGQSLKEAFSKSQTNPHSDGTGRMAHMKDATENRVL
jgi:hypothetical protein